MISNVDDDEKAKLNNINVEERCLLLVNTLGGVQECLMLTEDEKVRYIIPTLEGIQECLMLTEDEKLNLQLVGAGQRREVVMLTEEEKVLNNIYTLGGIQRNKYE